MTNNKISWWRTNFTDDEIKKISESIKNECISMGKVTEEFEQRLSESLQVPYVVSTTSGSIALLMALMAIEIKPGDEVIVPNRTWIATAHAPMILGAKPILVDVLPDCPIIDTSLIEEKITEKTRAIMPVQLNGRSVKMEEVWKIAKKYNLKVIEDSAQGLFSKYKGTFMGTESDAGCFSFSVAKLIPTGQGGFVATKQKSMYEKLKLMRTHGVDNVNDGSPFLTMGFNFRYTDLQASIGLIQLDKVKERINNLVQIHKTYREGLSDIDYIKFLNVDIENGEIPLYSEILIKDRHNLVEHLKSNNIETRPFYPDLDTAKHLQSDDNFPNAHIFGEQGLVLPSGPAQELENIDKVIKALRRF